MNQRKYITDPEILGQLNDSNNVNTGKKYINDPALLKQLNKPQGASLENAFPQINPNWTQGAGALAMAGNPAIAAGKGLAPIIANAIGRIGAGTAGGTAFDVGSKENKESTPELIKKNALLNTGIEALTPAIKYGSKAVGAVANAFRPQRHAEELINKLGSGQDLENVGKSVSQNIKESFNNIQKGFNERYDAIFKHSPLANGHIYPSVSPIQGTQRYGNLDKLNLSKDNFTDPDLRKMYEGFVRSPTLSRSHDFQKELGKEIGSLTRNKKNLDDAARAKLKLYKQTRDAVNQDAYSFLKKENPQMAKEFKQLSEDYKSNYLPYTEKKSLFSIASGTTDNPTLSSLVNIFRNPGKKTNSILSHMPEDFKNKIAHLGLAQEIENVSPSALNKAVFGFGKRGLNSYLSPDIKNELIKMGTKQYLGRGLESAIGGLAGYELGNLIGQPHVGATAGAITAPFAASKIGPIYRGGKRSKNRLLDDIIESGFAPASRFYEKLNKENKE